MIAAPFCPIGSLLDLDDDGLALFEDFLDAGMRGVRLAVEGLGDDVLNGQETVALGAVVDEGGVQAGLNAGDDSAVDVAAGEAGFRYVDFVVLQDVALDDGDTQLFRPLRVDQHSASQAVSVYGLDHGKVG